MIKILYLTRYILVDWLDDSSLKKIIRPWKTALLFCLFVVSHFSWPFLQGVNSSCFGNSHWGLDLPFAQ